MLRLKKLSNRLVPSCFPYVLNNLPIILVHVKFYFLYCFYIMVFIQLLVEHKYIVLGAL